MALNNPILYLFFLFALEEKNLRSALSRGGPERDTHRRGGRRPAARTTGCAGFNRSVISRIHRDGCLPAKNSPFIAYVPSLTGDVLELRQASHQDAPKAHGANTSLVLLGTLPERSPRGRPQRHLSTLERGRGRKRHAPAQRGTRGSREPVLLRPRRVGRGHGSGGTASRRAVHPRVRSGGVGI